MISSTVTVINLYIYLYPFFTAAFYFYMDRPVFVDYRRDRYRDDRDYRVDRRKEKDDYNNRIKDDLRGIERQSSQERRAMIAQVIHY